ncbi:MAG: DNA repair protein RecO [Bacilli bacterium]
MEIISVEGFILSSLKFNESSKILNILTKEYGIIGVMSKGCLNLKSKLRLSSENFNYAVFHMYYKEDKLSILIAADTIDYLSNIKSDIIKIGYLSYLSELTRNVYKQTNEKDIYDIFISSIKKINEGFNPEVITNIVELKYLDYLGVGINLDSCVVCGSSSIAALSSSKGGYVCAKCMSNETVKDVKTLKMLRLYYYVDISKITTMSVSEEVSKNIDHFLKYYYEEYTGLYLKSKKFLTEIK